MSEQQRTRRRPKSVTVVATERLSPELVRVILTGEDLRQLPPLEFTDHYVKLLFPPPGAAYAWPFDPEQLRATRPADEWPLTRTYTIRWFDRDTARLAIDFVVHGDQGIAGPWAAAVQPGEQIGFLGPGGAWAPDPAAGDHLLVGDESALPAIAAALDALPTGAPARAFLEVSSPEAEVPVRCGGGIDVTWVHRGAHPHGTALAATVRAAVTPTPELRAFVHGNAEMVKDLRRWLFVEHRVPRDQVSISGYWRTGLDEAGWQSTKRDFNAELERDEARLTDVA
ncbi:NADPH-dependent ferric siderophore reductase [Enemella dayhoffiae]|uniref:NADPH-dependent ferric siderophore reductase n=1 Tax=Enemella dayhoffiae TaxID=2016507 RepID=A0A255H2T8_9ACTN|nr:siderophore-interacting protein [Enemella dayhoffiae]OYO20984.1 NADPH-dependent ferric siderophore reductase [Enemella dayhoffiae]